MFTINLKIIQENSINRIHILVIQLTADTIAIQFKYFCYTILLQITFMKKYYSNQFLSIIYQHNINKYMQTIYMYLKKYKSVHSNLF